MSFFVGVVGTLVFFCYTCCFFLLDGSYTWSYSCSSWGCVAEAWEGGEGGEVAEGGKEYK